MKASKKSVYYIEVVGRALDVLEVFLDETNPQLSLKDIAGHLNQSMNTTFRLLYTLGEHGYIVKTNKMYRLGSKLLDLSNAELRNTDLIAIAGPYMDALRDRFGETVNLGVMKEAQIRYIDVRQSLERYRLAETVGESDPLHSTRAGQGHPGVPAILGCAPTASREREAALYRAHHHLAQRHESRVATDARARLRPGLAGEHARRVLHRRAGPWMRRAIRWRRSASLGPMFASMRRMCGPW